MGSRRPPRRRGRPLNKVFSREGRHPAPAAQLLAGDPPHGIDGLQEPNNPTQNRPTSVQGARATMARYHGSIVVSVAAAASAASRYKLPEANVVLA